jgi:cytochrome P450/NADPH-cytochrome P450 reductase
MTIQVDELVPIPAPPGLPFLGNLFDVDVKHPIESLMELSRQHGPIFKLAIPGASRVVVSSADLVDEICDDSRFDKVLAGGLLVMRNWGNDGLFTARTHEPNWQKAHNILLPNFSLQAMQRYMPMMLDLAQQMVQKWARLNPDDTVDVAHDMTNLTFDMIGLAGFGYRFNSFYRETPHPFVAAIIRMLERGQTRARQVQIQRRLDRKTETERLADDAYMRSLVDQIIRERRASGTRGAPDLLSCMLDGVDPKSGEGLPDENIFRQCVTFLTAGHETTSGLLSFATYFLLKHPEVAERAREEVDRVFGTDLSVLPTYEQVHRLRYITQILNETLRLWPTAPGFSRHPYEDTVIGGKYQVTKDTAFLILIPMLHRDPAAWGDDAETFNPDRFGPENPSIPWRAFRPFGDGQRACIGRQFAMQEAALVLGMVLQRFELIDYLDYQLKIKTTLTIKPDSLLIKIKPRPGRTMSPPAVPVTTSPNGTVSTDPAPLADAESAATLMPAADRHNTPLLVLFGSNLGTAEGIAHQIATGGANRGYAVTVRSLDEHAGALPNAGAVVIVTAWYNGNPPDNAEAFCKRLRDTALPADAFAGVRYAVFGCGNRDWAATYQAIPTLIDTELAAHGAQRIYRRGEGDARDSFDDQYRAWYSGLWQAVGQAFALNGQATDLSSGAPRLKIELINKRATSTMVASYNALPMVVRANRELRRRDGERPSERSTRHIEIILPAGVSYSTGDHLGVLPRNGLEAIERVLARFKLDPGLYVTISPTANARTHLPLNEPLPVVDVLSSYVEVQDVPARAQIAALAEHTANAVERAALVVLAGDDAASAEAYHREVVERRLSLLDLLEAYPGCALPFDTYLEMLPPLRPRYYSISSSPLVTPTACSLTVSVVDAAAKSGRGAYHGTCSNYFATRPVGGTVFAFVRKPSLPFQPPANPHQPMIMVGPGTGVAPFRGFLQERAALKRQGVPVGESLLFFGCRDPQQDHIYEKELSAYERAGVVKLHTAFSREPGQPKRYVQQAIAEQAGEIWRLIEHGAAVYVCGDATRMAPDVRGAFIEICRAQAGGSEADAEAWLAGLRAENRYLEDIWGSSGA